MDYILLGLIIISFVYTCITLYLVYKQKQRLDAIQEQMNAITMFMIGDYSKAAVRDMTLDGHREL